MSRCRPTLASLLSGRWPHQSGVYYNYGCDQPPAGSFVDESLDPKDSLPMLLKEAGYATYCAGKFWEGDARRMGFTHGPGKEGKNFVRKGQDGLSRFLETIGEQPFFVWWAPRLPHTPHDPPAKYLRQFDPKTFPVPPYVKENRRAEFLTNEHKSYAMETWLDDGVRQLMAKLRDLGKDKDTLVIFVMDNGWSNGLISKGSPFEKGVRTPLVFHWPCRINTQRFDDLVSSLDVPPTILDYVGVPIPQAYAGRSLKGMMEGSAHVGRDALFGAIYPAFATEGDVRPERDVYALYVRSKRWKYIHYLQDVRAERNRDHFRIEHICTEFPTRSAGDEELFDLDSDPYELKNLASDGQHGELLGTFKNQVHSWWESTGGKPLNVR